MQGLLLLIYLSLLIKTDMEATALQVLLGQAYAGGVVTCSLSVWY